MLRNLPERLISPCGVSTRVRKQWRANLRWIPRRCITLPVQIFTILIPNCLRVCFKFLVNLILKIFVFIYNFLDICSSLRCRLPLGTDIVGTPLVQMLHRKDVNWWRQRRGKECRYTKEVPWHHREVCIRIHHTIKITGLGFTSPEDWWVPTTCSSVKKWPDFTFGKKNGLLPVALYEIGKFGALAILIIQNYP